MRDLLFLAHRIPYPPNKGDKIRAWHLLKHLAERRRVHLGCFIDDPVDWEHVPVLEKLCASTCFRPLSRRTALLRSLPAVLTEQPLTVPYYRDGEMTEWAAAVRRQHRPTVFVFSSSMAQYASETHPGSRRVIDFVDVDSAKWSEYAARKRWPTSAIYRREGRTLQQTERRIARDFDASVFVSEAEAELFRRCAPESAGRVHAISNGVDATRFSPDTSSPDPYGGAGGDVLCFTGMMDYWPNVDAVVWFASSVLPLIRERRPSATFWIVGANPAPAVTELARQSGIVVTGRVPDTRPYIAHAASVVAPLRIARGIQNKVLEAMAMGKAVVASTAAFEGIDAEPGRDLLVADEAAGFSEAVQRAMAPAAALSVGRAAREVIERRYTWREQLSKLDGLLAELEEQRAAPDERRIA